jgi:uncharacterized protein
MKGEAVVDTSVLVDAIVEEAQKHAEAGEKLASLQKMRIPCIVIYELVWVLGKLGVEPGAVRNVVEALMRNSRVAVVADDGTLAERAIRRVVDEKTTLSNFNDKVVLETALKSGVPILTYDRELEREARLAGI